MVQFSQDVLICSYSVRKYNTDSTVLILGWSGKVMSLRREAYIGVQLRGELLEVKLGCRRAVALNFY